MNVWMLKVTLSPEDGHIKQKGGLKNLAQSLGQKYAKILIERD